MQTRYNDPRGDYYALNPISDPWLSVAVETDSLTATGARVALDRGEDLNRDIVHPETIGWIAIESGRATISATDGDVVLDATVTAPVRASASNVRMELFYHVGRDIELPRLVGAPHGFRSLHHAAPTLGAVGVHEDALGNVGNSVRDAGHERFQLFLVITRR